MSKIVFTNKSATEGLSFTSHGNGRIDLEPGQVLEMELDNARGPFILNYLTAFYAKYAEKMTVSITLDDSGSEAEVPQIENVPESTASSYTGLKDDFNDLLAKMKACGLMAPDEEEPDPDPEP